MESRNELIAHGTTIELNFYEGKEYFPHTPTLGCLCTVEIWSPKDGKLICSDQAALINAVEKLNDQSGYFVVVEIDDKNAPVTLNDVLPEILKAEDFLLNNH
jgi:hypothetical protein